jgi:hypothetical protein
VCRLRRIFPAPPSEGSDTGIERYKTDAIHAIVFAVASFDSWSERGRSPASPMRRSVPAFYPGRFMELLLKRLEALPDQDLALNVVLTGVLARLAGSAHPTLRAFMLDPRLPLARGVRSPPLILAALAETTVKEAARIEKFDELLKAQRMALQVDGLVDGDSAQAAVLRCVSRVGAGVEVSR